MSDILAIEKSAHRKIKSGLQYDSLFPKADLKDDVLIPDGNIKDTVKLMREVVLKYLDDTKLIAPILQGKTVQDTCRNIWNFLYSHIQYKLDKNGLEQLRRPARSWHDRTTGIDCDCFTIFASSILTNLNIPHSYRIAKYTDKFQHVYDVVLEKGQQHTIDPVAHHFNYEEPYKQKIDFNMAQLNGIPIAVLSGFDNNTDNELFNILSGADFEEMDSLLGLGKIPSEEIQLDAIYKHLVSTRDYITKNPQSVITTGGAAAHLQMLNYAIDNWNTPNREKALDDLEAEEERWNEHNGVSGLGNTDDDDEVNGLGAPKGLKKFWSKVKDTVKKVKDTAKNAGKNIEDDLKKIGKVLIRFNPLSLAVRGGFLLAMKINLLDMGGHIYPAYLTEVEAKAKGISSDKWNKSKNALAKIEKMFVDVLQGKSDKLKSAIITGRAKRHFAGFGSLGEPATIASVVASATPIIAAAKSINSEGANDGTGEKLPEDKGALIEKIKEWWKKTFGKETATAPETISDADKAPNESAQEEKSSDTNTTSTDTNTNERDKAPGPNAGDSGWMKFKQFVKDNPVAIGISVAAVGTVVTLAIVHHNHKKAEQQKQLSTAQAGLGKKGKKKRKTLQPPPKMKMLL